MHGGRVRPAPAIRYGALLPGAAGDQPPSGRGRSGADTGGAAEYPVIESLTALIEEWCAACPVALAVDDVHWADPASVLLLHRLGRVAGQLPLLLAATLRSGAGRPDVDALTQSWRGHGAVQIMLGPLPDSSVDQLVTGLAGGVPGPVLRGLISSAAGNPLYISELVAGLAREMRLRAVGDVVDVEPDPNLRWMSPTLGMAIARRLAFLSGQTRELLQVAALLGAEFSVADVAAVLDRPVTDLLGPVREATAAGLLTAQADRLAFRHPLVRTALDDELPMSARQALHFQIAQTLTTRASPPRVAEHMLAAGPAAAPLLPWLAGAAEDLATRTPVLAAELLGQVLDTLTPPPEIADHLRAGLAASLLCIGNSRQAEQVARSALSVPSGPRTEAALRWTLANACTVRLARNAAPVLPAAGAIGLVRSLPPGLQRSVSVLSRLQSGLAIVVEMLAGELEPQGIRVNGFIADRCGAPDGFARAATFVLSPAASYLTGNVITIDGGDRTGHLAGVF